MALPAVKSKPTPRLVKAELPLPYKFSVEEFYRLDLKDNKYYELLEGVVYEIPAIGPRHAAIVRKLQDLFYEQYRSKAMISTQNPIHIGRQSLPQPDLALLQIADYGEQHSQAKDVYLLVEVADTTLTYDHNKLRVYAKAGIPEVWILNLKEYQIEVYLEPRGSKYRTQHLYEPGEAIAGQALKTKVEITW